jgi:hypothetical protein
VPLITFYEMVRNPRLPMRATKNAAGQLPDRHHRCEPVRTASGLGWYVFLPIDFQVVFDGSESIISLDDGETWDPLTSMQYPGFVDVWNANAPPDARGFVPPFCLMGEDHALLQIWTGFLVKTAPGYSILVRQPANIVPPSGYFQWEGVIETDRWFGPLFTNVKLIRTDYPIQFLARRPFLQLIPIHRSEYADSKLNDFVVHDNEALSSLTSEDWAAYGRTVVTPNADPVVRRQGTYAIAARKRRAEEER